MFYTLSIHETKRKGKFKPTFTFINKNMVNKWQRILFISFPLFPNFSLRQLTTNFETCLLSPENSLFVLKVCLLSSEMFEWFKSSGRSYWNLVKGRFSLLWKLGLCDMLPSEMWLLTKDPSKFNSFRRYFNQNYWSKLLNKLIINFTK